MARAQALNPEHIKELLEYMAEYFDYNRDAGEFTWKEPPGNRSSLIGKRVGSKHSTGYLRARITLPSFKKRTYGIHNLIWLWEYGEWVSPPFEIDHKYGDQSDNRIFMLRKVTVRENQQNQKNHRRGSLVGARKGGRSWVSRIKFEEKQYYLGRFPTELEAHLRYMKAVDAIEAYEEGVITKEELLRDHLINLNPKWLNEIWGKVEEDFDGGGTYIALSKKYGIKYNTIVTHFRRRKKQEEMTISKEVHS